MCISKDCHGLWTNSTKGCAITVCRNGVHFDIHNPPIKSKLNLIEQSMQ